MKTYDTPLVRWRSTSRLRIAACTETSSAETGSSHSTSVGLPGEGAGDRDPLLQAARERRRAGRRGAAARASPTRASSSHRARPASLPRAARPGSSSARRRMLRTVWLGFSAVSGFWNTICSCAAGSWLRLARPAASLASNSIAPPLGSSEADDALRERALAAARLAHQPEHLAPADLERDAGHRDHLVAAPEP